MIKKKNASTKCIFMNWKFICIVILNNKYNLINMRIFYVFGRQNFCNPHFIWHHTIMRVLITLKYNYCMLKWYWLKFLKCSVSKIYYLFFQTKEQTLQWHQPRFFSKYIRRFNSRINLKTIYFFFAITLHHWHLICLVASLYIIVLLPSKLP